MRTARESTVRQGLLLVGGPSTGSGRTESQSVPAVRRGVGNAKGVGGGGAPQRALGYRLSPVRRWGLRAGERWSWRRGSRCGGTVGSRTAPTRLGESEMRRGVGVGGAPPRAPGYRLSPVRRWGCAGRRVLVVAEAGPAAAGTVGSRTAPTRLGESEMRRGVGVGGAPPRAPGYRLSPVRRWGCAGRRVLVVAEAGPAAAGRSVREPPLRG